MARDDVSIVTELIAEALKLPAGQVTEDDSVQTIEQWDSLGHLNILIALDRQFSGQVGKIAELAKATSVKQIVSILQAHHVI